MAKVSGARKAKTLNAARRLGKRVVQRKRASQAQRSAARGSYEVLELKAETTLDNLVAALQRESRNADAERLHSTAGRSKERDLVIQLLWQGDADLD